MIFNRLRPVGASVRYQTSHEDISGYFPFPNLEFVDSGTSALALAIIDSLKSKPTPEPNVLMPAYACPDLLAAAQFAGVQCKLIDNLLDSYRFDLAKVEQAIDGNTIAIVAVNFLGSPQDMTQLRELADKNQLALIEDRAQYFPLSDESACLADYYIYSFGRGKPVNVLGGGAISSKKPLNRTTLERIEAQHNSFSQKAIFRLKAAIYNLIITPFFYGILDRLPFLSIGTTAYHPLNNISAMSKTQRDILPINIRRYIGRNRSIANNLALQVAQINGLTPLYEANTTQPLLRIAFLAKTAANKQALLAELNRAGLGASGFYPSALDEREDCAGYCEPNSKSPNAKLLATKLITIPTHENTTKAVNAKIINTLRANTGN